MKFGAQPPGRRGDIERPFSAMDLRLVLAVFGLVMCGLLAVLLWRAGLGAFGWVLAALAVVALGDIVVVQLRRRAARRPR
jgi:hypothetical protein